ncbi:MAG: UDP-2,4-diacetamido-2,4,6-trideoxy-beta-L-altropyranose hydrolase [Bacteroidota bacterium]
MAKRTIIFRADGGPSIGMGHFTRTLALAEMLNEHFHCIFATRQATENQVAEIEKICHGRIDLPLDDSHFDVFINQLKGDEIIVLDNYYFTTEYQKAIKTKGCKLVCIDDMHDKHYVADVVINHAPLNKSLFSTAIYTRLLIGLDYALLRNKFFQEQSKREIPKTFNKVFLCIGGADFNNLTSKILDDLIEIEQIELITVVIGNAYQSYNNLIEKIDDYSKKKRIELFRNLDAGKLIEKMRLSDFAIVPCSTILLEAISQRVPVITGYYIENQKEIAKNLKNKFNNILVLDDLNNTNIEHKYVEYLENSFEQPYAPLINKNTRERIITIFNSLKNEFELKVRNAEIKDTGTYFLWANNKSVRRNAINPEKIEYNNHIQWFKSKLGSKESFLYIFEKENSAIGQVRFDKIDSTYIVDYSIDEKFRGKGFGTSILKLGLEKLNNECKSNVNCKVKALVKVNNRASSKVFERFNFLNTGIIELKGSSFFEFEKEIK